MGNERKAEKAAYSDVSSESEDEFENMDDYQVVDEVADDENEHKYTERPVMNREHEGKARYSHNKKRSNPFSSTNQLGRKVQPGKKPRLSRSREKKNHHRFRGGISYRSVSQSPTERWHTNIRGKGLIKHNKGSARKISKRNLVRGRRHLKDNFSMTAHSSQEYGKNTRHYFRENRQTKTKRYRFTNDNQVCRRMDENMSYDRSEMVDCCEQFFNNSGQYTFVESTEVTSMQGAFVTPPPSSSSILPGGYLENTMQFDYHEQSFNFSGQNALQYTPQDMETSCLTAQPFSNGISPNKNSDCTMQMVPLSDTLINGVMETRCKDLTWKNINMSLRICPMYTNMQGSSVCSGGCDDLHICRFYLLGNCHQPCRFDHNINSSHNVSVLKRHELHYLNDEEVRFLAQKLENRNSTTVPIICKFYNNLGDCKNQKTCSYLHLCKHFVQGNCKFSDGCKRSHSLRNAETSQMLRKFGIDVDANEESEIIQALQKGIIESTDQMARNIKQDHGDNTCTRIPDNQAFAINAAENFMQGFRYFPSGGTQRLKDENRSNELETEEPVHSLENTLQEIGEDTSESELEEGEIRQSKREKKRRRSCLIKVPIHEKQSNQECSKNNQNTKTITCNVSNDRHDIQKGLANNIIPSDGEQKNINTSEVVALAIVGKCPSPREEMLEKSKKNGVACSANNNSEDNVSKPNQEANPDTKDVNLLRLTKKDDSNGNINSQHLDSNHKVSKKRLPEWIPIANHTNTNALALIANQKVQDSAEPLVDLISAANTAPPYGNQSSVKKQREIKQGSDEILYAADVDGNKEEEAVSPKHDYITFPIQNPMEGLGSIEGKEEEEEANNEATSLVKAENHRSKPEQTKSVIKGTCIL